MKCTTDRQLTVKPTTCKRRPFELASEPAASPTGRPYSPYPYRDLPKTLSPWEARAQPTHSAPPAHRDEFHLFSSLPTELRLQVWREAMLSACEHARVHRVRLALAKASGSDGDDPDHYGPRLEMLPTPQLCESTYSTRSLLSTCAEARQEALASLAALLPDTLPVAGGRRGLLRCNLARDVLLLADVSTTLLLALRDMQCLRPPSSSIPLLTRARHLALDLVPLLEREVPACQSGPPAAITTLPPDLESALVTLAASLPCLEQMYLLQTPVAVVNNDDASDSHDNQDPTDARPRTDSHPLRAEHAFIPSNGADINSSITTTTATTPAVSAPAAPAPQVTAPVPAATVPPPPNEWYTTRPPPAFRVGPGYYTHLRHLVRVVCQLRRALGAPDAPLVAGRVVHEDADSGEEEGGQHGGGKEGVAERLGRVSVRVLGYYAGVSGPGGSIITEQRRPQEGRGEEEEEEWLLSSPEKCLEVALGTEPRWVQWEWVCQCLDA